MGLISHFEFNVRDYEKSVRFYDRILPALGWTKINATSDFTGYTDGSMKLILCPTDPEFAEAGFHRKRIGLNHIAFAVTAKEQVDRFFHEVLTPADVPALYEGEPSGDEGYYAVYFEDPDRVKLEVVFAPHYCTPGHWPNTVENSYVPKA